jgi:uncharacterized protein YjiS (DUF1127 family)
MLNSQSAIAAVRRYSTPGRDSHVASRGRRDISPEQLTPTTDISEAKPAMAEVESAWMSVFWFFFEGFALYGASLHGLAATAVTAIGNEVGTRRPQELPWRERRKSISLVSSSTRAEIALVVREDAIDQTALGKSMLSKGDCCESPAREVDRCRHVHPSKSSMIWGAIAGRWARRRREREIKEAVAALAEYDDRMLLDIGVSDRSQIEHIGREGRDY